MNLQGEAALLNIDVPDYAAVKERYLARFPQSVMMFGFADFALWELRLQDAHLVLGFGQAYLSEAATPLAWIHQKPEQKPRTYRIEQDAEKLLLSASWPWRPMFLPKPNGPLFLERG
jgi:hypothetical protein